MTGQLGFFAEIEYEPEPVKGLCRCPRCHFEYWEDGVHPDVKLLHKLCYECRRLVDSSDARIEPLSVNVRLTVIIPSPVTVYRRGEIPEDLLILYRRSK